LLFLFFILFSFSAFFLRSFLFFLFLFCFRHYGSATHPGPFTTSDFFRFFFGFHFRRYFSALFYFYFVFILFSFSALFLRSFLFLFCFLFCFHFRRCLSALFCDSWLSLILFYPFCVINLELCPGWGRPRFQILDPQLVLSYLVCS